MNNDFYSPVWADNHHKLSDGIDALFKKIGDAFRRLHASQFDAPWRHAARQVRVRSAR